jgi:hypothetical protein
VAGEPARRQREEQRCQPDRAGSVWLMADSIRHVEQVMVAVTEWAASNPALRAVLLVGAQARGEARPDSDVDLVLLVDHPAHFKSDANWLPEIDWTRAGACPVARRDATYGVVWSRHVRLDNGLEVEFTFAPISWAHAKPIDAGTRHVVKNGCRILYDPEEMLSALVMQVGYDAPQSPARPPARRDKRHA